MAAGNAVNATSTGIQTFTGTAFTGSTVTQYSVLVGGASNAVASTTVGNAGQVLQSSGAGVNPAYSTATFPSTATGTGKVLIADGTNWVASTPTFPNASATSGKFIQSDGTNWIASTPTLPTTAGTSGKILISDGTNFISSTPTYPNAASTALKHIRSDGTNFITTTVTYPDASVTAGKVIISDGTNYVASTPTFPNTATGTGTLLRADGTNWVATTSTYPNTNALNTLLYASSANVMAALATATNGVLITDGTTGIPSISSTLPTAVQGNITSVGTIASGTWNGTAIDVAHGGTGRATLTNHGVLVGATTSAITQLAAGTNGQVLVGSTSADPVFATLGASAGSLTYTTGAGTLNIDVLNYATGTWTPTVIGSATAGTTTYTTQVGFYIRVFNMVYVEATLVITGATGTGNASFGALPFTVKNTANYQPIGTFSLASATWTWTGTGTQLNFKPVSNTTAANVDSLKSTGAAFLAIQNSAATFTYSCWYQV